MAHRKPRRDLRGSAADARHFGFGSVAQYRDELVKRTSFYDGIVAKCGIDFELSGYDVLSVVRDGGNLAVTIAEICGVIFQGEAVEDDFGRVLGNYLREALGERGDLSAADFVISYLDDNIVEIKPRSLEARAFLEAYSDSHSFEMG